MKVCIEDGCWQPTAGTRCTEHERAHQRARSHRAPRRKRAYRDSVIVGVCVCCGTDQDLTRHHSLPLAAVQDGLPLRDQGTLVPMCRSCNSSIGARMMVDQRCPQHGGTSRT